MLSQSLPGSDSLGPRAESKSFPFGAGGPTPGSSGVGWYNHRRQVIGIDANSGGGVVGTVGGVTASPFDAFLLDRLLQRWKPDHFVEEPPKVVIPRVNR